MTTIDPTIINPILIGGYANDGTGDDLRTAFQKVNSNFALLQADVTGATNLGAGAGIYAQKNSTNLEFKSLSSTDNSVIISETDTSINLAAAPKVVHDTHPALGGDLDLQGHRIFNGDAQTTVYGFDVPGIAGMIQLLIESNQMDLDFNGHYADLDGFNVQHPTSAELDFNGTGNINFSDSAAAQLELDFGTF